jgi:molecular chaperone Hsp33
MSPISTPTAALSFTDYVQPFQIEAAGVRGRLVRLGPSLDAAMARHDYPPAVATMLAETLALTAVLASGLKYDGVFTLQIHGDGPVGLMVADLTSDGAMRAYARFDAARMEAAGPGPEAPVPKLLGAGHMAFTVDQGPDTERYQGITSLEGSTLTDCAHTYFRQSEQLDTAIILCSSDMATPHCARRAAALMIQRLPPSGLINPEAEDDWRRAVILMSSVSVAEMLEPALEPEMLLYRLFHEDGVRVYRQRPLHHQCRCSRTRVERTLMAFPRAEIEDMAEDGIIRVTCEFCKAEYVLDEQARDRLFG